VTASRGQRTARRRRLTTGRELRRGGDVLGRTKYAQSDCTRGLILNTPSSRRSGPEAKERRSNDELDTRAAHDRASRRTIERLAYARQARLRGAVDVEDPGLPPRAGALVTRKKEQHGVDVGLTEGERERLLVVGSLSRLDDRLSRRRLGARVERGLGGWYLGLNTELAVEDRQLRAGLRSAVERPPSRATSFS
jgi:hypothetical protein